MSKVTVTDRRKAWESWRTGYRLFGNIPALRIQRWVVPKRWRRSATKIRFDDIRNERI